MGVMGRAIGKSGLDDRFMLFVSGTMALSVLASVAGGAAAALLRGNADAAAATFFTGLVGAGMVFGPMLVVGLLVSIPVFAIVWRLSGGEEARPVSAEYAGVATAGDATILWVALLTFVNGDGVGSCPPSGRASGIA